MKKFVVNGLLALSLTAGIVTLSVDAPAKVHAVNVQPTQAQVQPSGYSAIWFDHNYLTRDDWWVTAPEKLTVTSTTNYTLQVKQYSYDNTNIEAVRYLIANETTGNTSPWFEFVGNGKHIRSFTLSPGTYRIDYRSWHATPIEIRGDLFPS
ncbi:hypothetical protein [Paenibacillus elgii]|uniref:hypothetical protein n=1 Tax=Paenibacillus elgii TaxID=189691 RepID=UPI000FDBF675|nr:hypothetical protein [Paenibacillus elgii]NEN86932.1 hypothetical protein [Paenibacillus elgii]